MMPTTLHRYLASDLTRDMLLGAALAIAVVSSIGWLRTYDNHGLRCAQDEVIVWTTATHDHDTCVNFDELATYYK